MKHFSIKKARNGQGIFADKDFKPGTKLFQITGKLITCDVDDDLDETTRSNAIRYDKDRYISPAGKIADHANHSCKPNAKIVKVTGKKNAAGKKPQAKLFFVARTTIQRGDEITFDYSTITASDDVWEMKCNCGEDNCRGTVKNFSKLPKKLRDYYIEEGIVPKFIVAI